MINMWPSIFFCNYHFNTNSKKNIELNIFHYKWPKQFFLLRYRVIYNSCLEYERKLIVVTSSKHADFTYNTAPNAASTSKIMKNRRFLQNGPQPVFKTFISASCNFFISSMAWFSNCGPNQSAPVLRKRLIVKSVWKVFWWSDGCFVVNHKFIRFCPVF